MPGVHRKGSGIATDSLSYVYSFRKNVDHFLTGLVRECYYIRIMTGHKPFPYDVLEADQNNIPITVELLTQYRILELCEQLVPQLFDNLLPSVEKAAPPDYFPFTREAGGVDVPTYDFILRLFMIQSAHQQYSFSLGHLYRGHGSEIPSHLRRAIESAGIAYLSKSKPELGDIFMSGDAKKLRKATSTQSILPPNDPLTADLLDSINLASKLTHNNFISFVSSVEKHDISMKDKQWRVGLTLALHGPTDLGEFLRLALLMLRAMERVLRVFAASFSLDQHSEWFDELEQFRRRLDHLYLQLDQLVNPIHDEIR